MVKQWILGVVLMLSVPAWANTWQVCAWQVELTQDSRPWQEQNWVANTQFEQAEVAAMEVSNKQAWEVQAKILDTHGRYTEPCRFAIGKEVRMVLWPDSEAAASLPKMETVLPHQQRLVVEQHITMPDLAKQQLSSDDFTLLSVIE